MTGITFSTVLHEVISIASAFLAVVLTGCAALLTAWIATDAYVTASYRARVRRQTHRINDDATEAGVRLSDTEHCSHLDKPWWGRPVLQSRGRPIEIVALCELHPQGQKLLRVLDQAGLSDKEEGILQWWLLGTTTAVLIAWGAGSVLLAGTVGVCSVGGGMFLLQNRIEKCRQNLRNALPDLFDALARALRAGQSFPQAVHHVLCSEQKDSVVAGFLKRLDADITLGRSSTESITHYAQETGLRELRIFATVMGIAGRIGGNVPHLLEQIALTTRQDLLLNRKLKVQTAQGRMSVRLVGSVPIALIALMSLVMPGYLAVWLSSSGGRILFVLALCLIVTGFLWVRKVVNINV